MFYVIFLYYIHAQIRRCAQGGHVQITVRYASHSQIQTHTPIHTQTHMLTDPDTDTHANRHTHTNTLRQKTYKPLYIKLTRTHSNKRTHSQIATHIGTCSGKYKCIHSHKHSDMQIDSHTNIYIHTYTLIQADTQHISNILF